MFPFLKTIGTEATPSQDHFQKPLINKNGIEHFYKQPKAQQKMLQSLEQCPPHNIRYKTKKSQSPLHCRNDRQHPLTSSSHRHHCHTTTTKVDANRSPSKLVRHLSPDIISDNISPQQVSHFTIVNPISSMDTCLITDTAIDGHTSFHTTLQVITSQGSKPLHVKVNLGASCSSIPLSCFCKAFPKYFTKSGSIKKTALKPSWMTWSAMMECLKLF